MNQSWLILDATYLMHRAHHATGQLDRDGAGALYGFFSSLRELQSRFQTTRVAFCFDKGRSRRHAIFDGYKKARYIKYAYASDNEIELRNELHEQITRLRDGLLERIGYRNVSAADGYEADDLIAAATNEIGRLDYDFLVGNRSKAIIVGSDHDLFQLIRSDVSVWNPQTKVLTHIGGFFRRYGVTPSVWASVKALAGCDSDSIPGVGGVGEKTACKYLAGKLKPTSKVFRRIESRRGREIFEQNLKLTRLPFPGTPAFEPSEDRVTAKRWREVMRELGLGSMELRAPVLS